MADDKKGAFGKGLFSRKKDKREKEVPVLYDFAKHGILDGGDAQNNWITVNTMSYVQLAGTTASSVMPSSMPGQVDEAAEAKKKEEAKDHITPKGLFETRHLNLENLGINCDPGYIDKTIKTLESKLKLMKNKGDSGSVGYGRKELESMVTRIANRVKFAEYRHFYEEYPYTSNDLINASLKKHTNLRCKSATEFIPDFPSDAVATMEAYTDNTMKLCGHKPVFYVVADKKDFGEVMKKRDPILLAQSPFGFFWQVLGAWDKEMILLEEL